MVALGIEDLKSFTAGLFIGSLFDHFLVREASIITYNKFTIDGRIRGGYFSGEEREEQQIGAFSSWKTLKPFCFSLIKGKRLPESFRIVFLLPEDAKQEFVNQHGAGLSPEQVGALCVNIIYENSFILCTTGISVNIFTTNRTLEHEWDARIREFLRNHEIAFLERG